MRSKKYIETPEQMEAHFEAYKIATKSRPILVHDFVGKDGNEVYRKRERPLTMLGFYTYLAKNKIISDASDYFENDGDRYDEFKIVCQCIKNEITSDQIEGGMANIYNHTITARLNNLTEKIQDDGTKKVILEVTYGDSQKENNTE